MMPTPPPSRPSEEETVVSPNGRPSVISGYFSPVQAHVPVGVEPVDFSSPLTPKKPPLGVTWPAPGELGTTPATALSNTAPLAAVQLGTTVTNTAALAVAHPSITQPSTTQPATIRPTSPQPVVPEATTSQLASPQPATSNLIITAPTEGRLSLERPLWSRSRRTNKSRRRHRRSKIALAQSHALQMASRAKQVMNNGCN